MSERDLELAVKALRDASYVLALTGAGISTESGIPAFRGSQGLWERYDPEEYAHISSFLRNPKKVWGMLKELYGIMKEAQPNPAHEALALLEEHGLLKGVITQNVDGLHQRAGSKRVIEFHGSGETLICLSCGRVFKTDEVSLEDLPPTCPCGGLLKPQIVFFGEPIPPQVLDEAFQEADKCDLMLVVGTSAQVYPAAQLPYKVVERGGKIVEVNLEETPLTRELSTIFLKGSASQILPRLVKRVLTSL